MSLPNGIKWEPINDAEFADGWIGLLGACDRAYYFGTGPAGGRYLEIVEPSDRAAFEGVVAPDRTWSIKVRDKRHAERIIKAIEG